MAKTACPGHPSISFTVQAVRCFFDSENGTVLNLCGLTVSQLLASAGVEQLYGPDGAVAAFQEHHRFTHIQEGCVYRSAFGQ